MRLRTALSLVALASSVQLMALSDGYDGEFCPTEAVYLASPAYCFEANFTALFVQPTANNLQYAVEGFSVPVNTPSWQVNQLQPDLQFGFDVGLGWVFHDAGSDLTLDWEHFRNSSSSSFGTADGDVVGSLFEIGSDAAPYNSAYGKVTFELEAIDLDYGIYASWGSSLRTRLFTGLGFASIKQTLFSEYTNADEEFTRTINMPSSFAGVGPQLGLDFSYRICDGFHFTGSGVATILVGSAKSHTTYQSFSPALADLSPPVDSPNVQTARVESSTQIVPNFGARLGLAYTWNFCDYYAVKLEAGYEAQVYLNALQSVVLNSESDSDLIGDSAAVLARTFRQTSSDFGLAGPYVSLNVTF